MFAPSFSVPIAYHAEFPRVQCLGKKGDARFLQGEILKDTRKGMSLHLNGEGRDIPLRVSFVLGKKDKLKRL
jgi:hypothetical protein